MLYRLTGKQEKGWGKSNLSPRLGYLPTYLVTRQGYRQATGMHAGRLDSDFGPNRWESERK